MKRPALSVIDRGFGFARIYPVQPDEAAVTTRKQGKQRVGARRGERSFSATNRAERVCVLIEVRVCTSTNEAGPAYVSEVIVEGAKVKDQPRRLVLRRERIEQGEDALFQGEKVVFDSSIEVCLNLVRHSAKPGCDRHDVSDKLPELPRNVLERLFDEIVFGDSAILSPLAPWIKRLARGRDSVGGRARGGRGSRGRREG